jgi:hypothetical protein
MGEASCSDGGGGALVGTHRVDRAPLPESQNKGKLALISLSNHVAHTPAPAVVRAQRRSD